MCRNKELLSTNLTFERLQQNIYLIILKKYKNNHFYRIEFKATFQNKRQIKSKWLKIMKQDTEILLGPHIYKPQHWSRD